jgi:hypothetical protein
MHDGFHNPLLAWLIYVISLYFELTKMFVVYVQGVTEVNRLYLIPWYRLLSCASWFHWEDRGPTSSFFLVEKVRWRRSKSHLFSLIGKFCQEYPWLLFFPDSINSFLGPFCDSMNLSFNLFLWSNLFLIERLLFFSLFVRFHFHLQEFFPFNFLSLQFCLDRLLGSFSIFVWFCL